jgi:hypothetical protein
MENHSNSARKKGLSTGAKIGIGCGGLALLVVIGMVVAGLLLGDKMVKFAEDAQKNPTRTAADLMVTASMGSLEMVAEDDVNKRYTLKETATGSLTTIYWNEKKNSPETITGDFSAIPTEIEAAPAPVP